MHQAENPDAIRRLLQEMAALCGRLQQGFVRLQELLAPPAPEPEPEAVTEPEPPCEPTGTAAPPLRQRILDWLECEGRLTRPQLIAHWPGEERQIRRELLELVSAGLIEKRGRARATHYVPAPRVDTSPIESPRIERPLPPPEPTPAPPPAVPQKWIENVLEALHPRLEQLVAVVAEVEQEMPFLSGLPVEALTAQLSIWAGLARKLQDELAGPMREVPSLAIEVRGLFGRLSRITRDYPSAWVDALWRGWETDWSDYVLFHRHRLARALGWNPPPEQLGDEAEAEQHRARLAGLLVDQRRLADGEANAVLQEALYHLDPDDPAIVRIGARFPRLVRGLAPAARRSTERRRKGHNGSAGRTKIEVEPRILTQTRGKRAAMVGGEVREDARERLERAFEFVSLEWVATQGGAPRSTQRLAQRIDAGSYDLVIFLISFLSHSMQPVIKRCTGGAVPTVLLNHGYGVSALAGAIEEQLLEDPAGVPAHLSK